MQEKTPELLNWEEAVEVLRSVDDPITERLMNLANFEVIRRFVQLKELPVASFDLKFFMEVMRSFCGDHQKLGRVLAGEDLSVFSTEDFQSQ